MKSLNNKTIILAFGILVALAILIASVYFREASSLNENTSGDKIPKKKIQSTVLIKKILEKASFKVHL